MRKGEGWVREGSEGSGGEGSERRAREVQWVRGKE